MEHLPLALSITTVIIFFISFYGLVQEVNRLKRQSVVDSRRIEALQKLCEDLVEYLERPDVIENSRKPIPTPVIKQPTPVLR